MTIINLRTYCKQIRQLIDTGQTEEAISHCFHILQIYPKHLDTYRVLGEAYLESDNHSEAADIFQRVLSSIPDDFVAHIGMSVIREEDEKLDEAIWHMERAFEMQPSNSTIQSEIRRLYGSREGIEPQKVRLTRGALARMYVKGSLYPQAIGELQAALTEDQNRFDLKVLLSEVYFKSGKEEEGIRTAEEVLSKLPYCYSADLLLADFYENRKQVDNAKLYRDRLIELDPYIAHLDDIQESPAEIPDNAVEIEKYVISPLVRSEGEEALKETELLGKENGITAEEAVAASAVAEIVSELEDDDVKTSSEEMTLEEAVSEEIEPAQHSDWQGALEEETILEDDTKPVVVTHAVEDEVDNRVEFEPDAGPDAEPESDIPDWLQELADEETATEPETDIDQSDLEPQEVITADEPNKVEVKPEVTSPVQEATDEVTRARMALESGDREEASALYSDLIKSRQNLPTVIRDLEKAAVEFPEDADIQHKLGDAYLRNNQITEAMQAYSKAERHL